MNATGYLTNCQKEEGAEDETIEKQFKSKYKQPSLKEIERAEFIMQFVNLFKLST